MPFTHRGQEVGGNAPRVSRSAKRDISSLARMSGGDTRNIPVEHLKSAIERHGADIVTPIFNAVQSHAESMYAQQQRQAQRAERIEGLKNTVVNKIAPYRATAYEMDLGFGGHEEGGWYYDIKDPVEDSRPFLTRRGAMKAAESMKQVFPAVPSPSGSRYNEETGEWQRGYRSSVYQGGDYRVGVQRGRGKRSPDSRPYYE